MAQAVERLLSALNRQHEIEARMDNGGYATQAEFDVDADLLDKASESVVVHMGNVGACVYEFRKRRDRAALTAERKEQS